VAKNLCIDHLKKRKGAREISLDQSLPAVERHESGRSKGRDPQFHCIRNQEDARLLEAMGKLEASRRVVLVLYYFQGLSYKEISEAVGVPVSTVKIRIFRAKKALLSLMKESDAEGNLLRGKGYEESANTLTTEEGMKQGKEE
jgi:RNA polymerase sigma-70 factor (ECF subfamily)